jgi:hypothetical protein
LLLEEHRQHRVPHLPDILPARRVRLP